MTARRSFPAYAVLAAALCAAAALVCSCESSVFSGPPATADVSLTLTSTPSVASAIDSLTISFTTSKAAATSIEYGTASGGYESVVLSSASATSHAIGLSGLAAGTVYYYRVVAASDDSKSYTSAEYTATTTAEDIPSEVKSRGIWLLGGIAGASYADAIAAVDLYDPETGAWYDTVTSLPTPVSFAGFAAYDGKLYAVGGIDADGNLRDIVQVYDIEANEWADGALLPEARANVTASVVDGCIYILGGSYGPLAGTGWNGRATTLEYDAAGDRWTTGADRTAFGALGNDRFSFAYDNVVYNLGGRTGALAPATTFDGYVPAFDSLLSGTAEVALAAGRAGFSGAVYSPESGMAFAMILGGITTYTAAPYCFVNEGASSANATSAALCIAAPFTAPAAWVTASRAYPLSVAYAAAAVTTAVSPARIYNFGGTGVLGSAAEGASWAYWSAVPESGSAWSAVWTAVAMPRGRWGHGAVTLDE